MRLLLTRPREDSEALAALLAMRGHSALIEPLLEIAPKPDAPLDLSGVQAVLLTSANGARALAGRAEAVALPAYAVGAATAEAARQVGFAQVESADGDVHSLAALVAAKLKPADGALLHVCGQHVAGDLAGELSDFEVRRAVLYEARAIEALSDATQAALRAGEVDGVLLFSPRTAATLARLAAAAGLEQAFARVTAYCLSAAVAEAARPLPWRRVAVAARPEQAALLELLEGEPVTEERSPGPRRGRTLAWAAGVAAVAFLLGLAAWPLLGPRLQDRLPEPLRDPTTARLAALEARLAQLEARPAESGSGPSAAEQIDPLARRVSTLERELAALAARPQPAPPPAQLDPRQLERLDRIEAGLARLDEMAALLRQSEEIEGRLAQLEAAREKALAASRDSALIAALGQLREAVRAGQPYGRALEAVAALARDDAAMREGLAALGAHAGEGVPALHELSARFEELAGAAAHEAALAPDASWLDRVRHRLSGLVRVRRTGALAEGEGPDAIVARAEERLAAGDLAGAVAAVEALPRRSDALEAWLADARARLDADAALDALQARALARAAGA